MQVIQTQPMPRFQYQGGSPVGPGGPKFGPGSYGKMGMSPFRPGMQQMQSIEFDGKRLRKAVARKTVDYNAAIVEYLETRLWQRDYRDARAIQPDSGYYTRLIPPMAMLQNPINSVTTKFVRTSTNKMRCPIFCVVWTPEGRRLITGASSGEFTLWNGLTFNFETILQAHDSSVRCMVWSHNDTWMVTGDHAGYVKYWQSNMNNVKMFQGHKEAIRGIRWAPTDPSRFSPCAALPVLQFSDWPSAERSTYAGLCHVRIFTELLERLAVRSLFAVTVTLLCAVLSVLIEREVFR